MKCLREILNNWTASTCQDVHLVSDVFTVKKQVWDILKFEQPLNIGNLIFLIFYVSNLCPRFYSRFDDYLVDV